MPRHAPSATAGSGSAPSAPAVCFVDGATLEADGWCPAGEGYPITRPCPFACPECRGPLTWDGACFRCYGSQTPRDGATWRFTGAAYTYTETGPGAWHYRKIVDAGARVTSPAAARAHFAAVRAALTRAPALRPVDVLGDRQASLSPGSRAQRAEPARPARSTAEADRPPGVVVPMQRRADSGPQGGNDDDST